MFGHGCDAAGDDIVVSRRNSVSGVGSNETADAAADQQTRGQEERSGTAAEPAEAPTLRLVFGRESVGEVVLIHRKPPRVRPHGG